MSREEKIGCEDVSIEPCDDLAQAVISCGLEHLCAIGCFHAWCNNEGEVSWMRLKLDRVMGNNTG